jgi:hypothetical protein
MQSGDGGVYAFSDLPPANYDLTVARQGFKTVEVHNIKLDVAASRRIDANLPIGTITQSINVQATPPVLNTENASTGQAGRTLQIRETATASEVAIDVG